MKKTKTLSVNKPQQPKKERAGMDCPQGRLGEQGKAIGLGDRRQMT